MWRIEGLISDIFIANDVFQVPRTECSHRLSRNGGLKLLALPLFEWVLLDVFLCCQIMSSRSGEDPNFLILSHQAVVVAGLNRLFGDLYHHESLCGVFKYNLLVISEPRQF